MKKFTIENYKSFYAHDNYIKLNAKERKSLVDFTVEQIRLEKEFQ